jgi:putative ABC transport system permease protein
MAVCLLILQYVSFKLSFDQFHKKADNIYRVVNDRYQQGKLIQHGTITYSGVGRAMNNDFDDVVQNTVVEPSGEAIITYNDKKIAEPDLFFADSNFLSVFDFPLVAGDKNTVLIRPSTVLLSEKLIEKIFDYKGKDYNQFLGKAITLWTDSMPYKIEGVLKNVPENSICNSRCSFHTEP